MKRSQRGQQGFSLVEVMVTSGIAVGMALSLGMVLWAGARDWQAGQNQMTTSFELRRGIHSMARELAQTNTQVNQGQLEVLVNGVWMLWPPSPPPPPDEPSYPSVRFRVPQDLDGDGTVLDAAGVPEWSLVPITYSLVTPLGEQQQIQRTQPGVAGVVTPLTVAYGVTALSFRRQAATPSVLEMNVTVQRGAANGAQPVTLSTRVRLRN